MPAKAWTVGNRLAQGAAAVFDHARATLELVHGQARKRTSRAARRQGVAGAGDVIAQHGRGITAEEDRAGGGDACGTPGAPAHHDPQCSGARRFTRETPAARSFTWISQVLASRIRWMNSRRACFGS